MASRAGEGLHKEEEEEIEKKQEEKEEEEVKEEEDGVRLVVLPQILGL